MRRCEKRQHEDVAIPEHVASIGTATHPSGTHRGFVRIADGAHEMEESEANGSLELIIALDPDIGVRPAARPGRPLLDQESVETRRFGFDQVSNGVDHRRRRKGLGAVGRKSVQPSARAMRRSNSLDAAAIRTSFEFDAHRYPPVHIEAAGRDGSSRSNERRTDRHQALVSLRTQDDGPRPGERCEADHRARRSLM